MARIFFTVKDFLYYGFFWVPKTLLLEPYKKWSCVQLSKCCQELQNFDFQSPFSMSKIIRIFPRKFLLNNINLGAHFLLLTFFENFGLGENKLRVLASIMETEF